MTNITENPSWEPAVYQIGISDPIRGGTPLFAAGVPVDGFANVQALQLANRTSYLKQQIETLAAMAISFSTYDDIRDYAGVVTLGLVSGSGISGEFKVDPSDTTSPDNNGTILVDALGRRWKRLYSSPINVRWFGAIGNGTTDDTIAIQASVDALLSTGGSVYFPKGTYLVTSSISIDDVPISVYGDGLKSTTILFNPSIDSSLIYFQVSAANENTLSIRGISMSTTTSGLATAIKVDTKLTADSTQVNGENDVLFINDVRVKSTSGYWKYGLYVINTGGVHTKGLKISNSSSGQSAPECKGVFIEVNDSRVNLIRAISATDTYIYHTYRCVHVKSLAGSGKQIESVYFSTYEFVGCDTAVYFENWVGAVELKGGHMDVINQCIDSSTSRLFVARFTGCDFRKGQNGGSYTASPMIKLDDGETIAFTGCNFSGINNSVSSSDNVAFSFGNTITGTRIRRATFTGNTFKQFYSVASTTVSGSDITWSGNSYSLIASTVFQDTALDTSSKKEDGIITSSNVISLDNSGNQTVTVTFPSRYFPDAYPIAYLQQASTSSSDILSVRYNYDTSNNTQCTFQIVGNTVARSVRFSFTAIPSISSTTLT